MTLDLTGRRRRTEVEAQSDKTSAEFSAPVAYVMWLLAGPLFMHRLYLGAYISGVVGLLLTAAFGFVTYQALLGGHAPYMNANLTLAMVMLGVPLAVWLLGDFVLLGGLVKAANDPGQRLAEGGGLTAAYADKLDKSLESLTYRNLSRLCQRAVLLGWLGVHRFTVGKPNTGSAMLVTGFCILFVLLYAALAVVGNMTVVTPLMRSLSAPLALAAEVPMLDTLVLPALAAMGGLWWLIDAMRITIEASRVKPANTSRPSATVTTRPQSSPLARKGNAQEVAAAALARSRVQTNAPRDQARQPAGVYRSTDKSAGTAYLLWLLFGWLGAHHFYLGLPKRGKTRLFCTLLVIGSVIGLLADVDAARLLSKMFWMCGLGLLGLLFVDMLRIPAYIEAIKEHGPEAVDSWN